MSEALPIAYQIDDDGIVSITLSSHIDQAAPVVPEALDALVQTLKAVASNSAVKGILLHAMGSDWLPPTSAQAWQSLCSSGDARAIAAALRPRSQALRSVEQLGKPVAIVLDGTCRDLCLEFALACHFRMATGAAGQQFGLPLTQRGIPPSAGATQRLPRLVGIPAALPLLLTGAHWSTEQALHAGLLHAVQPTDSALRQAHGWLLAHRDAQAAWDAKGFRVPGGAGALASHATRSFTDQMAVIRKSTNDLQPAPLAVLTAVYEGTQLPIDAALDVEIQCAATALAEPASANQIRTLWRHADAARQLVHRPQGVPAYPIQRLGVLGAGLMGAGIAQVAATAGIDVVLIDTNDTQVRNAKDKIIQALTRAQPANASSIADRILATADMQLLQGCDFIIEAVFENRDVKAQLMHQAAQATGERPAHFVWASNTSTLPISGLAGQWGQPEQVIGMHFFSPVPRMPLLEIILGQRTSPATLARTLDLAATLGKTPILVNDSPGFYTSRIFCAYIDEGMAMLAEGVSPALIENAARQAGFATSPLAVTDEVSLDLQALVIAQAQKDGLPEKFQRRAAKPVVDTMNRLQRLGRKSGGGFYDYPDGGGKQLWPRLADEFPRASQQPDVDAVRTRLLSMQALESARCLEESVLTSAADGDIGSILGLGFPAWSGGTLSYIDTIGCDNFVRQCDQLADQHGERFRPSTWLRERAARQARFHAL